MLHPEEIQVLYLLVMKCFFTIEIFPLVVSRIECLALSSCFGIVSMDMGVYLQIDSTRILEQDLVETFQKLSFRDLLNGSNLLHITVEAFFIVADLVPVEDCFRPEGGPLLLHLVDNSCLDSLHLLFSWIPAGLQTCQEFIDPVLEEIGIFRVRLHRDIQVDHLELRRGAGSDDVAELLLGT